MDGTPFPHSLYSLIQWEGGSADMLLMELNLRHCDHLTIADSCLRQLTFYHQLFVSTQKNGENGLWHCPLVVMSGMQVSRQIRILPTELSIFAADENINFDHGRYGVFKKTSMNQWKMTNVDEIFGHTVWPGWWSNSWDTTFIYHQPPPTLPTTFLQYLSNSQWLKSCLKKYSALIW